jgi:phosphatidylinositol alpha-mannosyltransferase
VRVCLVTPYDLSHDGGVNRHVRSLAEALRELGHEPRVVGPASGEVPAGCDGLPGVVPLRANGSVARIGLLVSSRQTRAYLDRGDFDLVHVHEPLVPGPCRHALRWAKVPVVATFHANAEHERSLQTALRAVSSTGLARIAFGIAVSREAKRFSRAIYRGRIAVIPNGVDLDRFTRSVEPRRPVEHPHQRLRILFVGRFAEPRKGFGSLLEAAALLEQQGRPVEVHVVGAGPTERFERRAERLGVVFHGRVSDGELSAEYQEADVFCAPSVGGESFGMVLVEAMAAGCPVVASDIPGYAEAARGAALLTPAGDPGALAVALWRAGQDAGLRTRLVARGIARADALGWRRVTARVAHIYAVARTAPVLVPARRGLPRAAPA